jgi:hypothetical protein
MLRRMASLTPHDVKPRRPRFRAGGDNATAGATPHSLGVAHAIASAAAKTKVTRKTWWCSCNLPPPGQLVSSHPRMGVFPPGTAALRRAAVLCLASPIDHDGQARVRFEDDTAGKADLRHFQTDRRR